MVTNDNLDKRVLALEASVMFLAGEIDKMDKEMEDVVAVCAMLAAIVNAQGEAITRLTAAAPVQSTAR